MVLSLLGLSVYDTTSSYENATKFPIKSGDFINSCHCLLESFNNEKFIFLGSQESINKHQEDSKFQELFSLRNVTTKAINTDNLNDVFTVIMGVIIEHKSEKIIFDITHSFRDTIIMSVISTFLSQTIYSLNTTIIYAKDVKKNDNIPEDFIYETLNDIFHTSNTALIVTTFLNTLKVPPIDKESKIYKILNKFSIRLLSNQFSDIYKDDIPNLLKFIDLNKNKLFFIEPYLKQLKELLINIEYTKDKEIYEKFIFFSELFLEKNYLLHTSTYLIEAITYYIGKVLQDKEYINFDFSTYENQNKIVNLLKLTHSKDDFIFPNEYFIDINSPTFNQFSTLRDKVAKIRHNLAHINIIEQYGEIEKDLEELIKEFKSLIEEKKLENLIEKDDLKKYSVDYCLKQIYDFKIKPLKDRNRSSNTKIETILKKYRENKLSDLKEFNQEKIKNFMEKEAQNIEYLQELKKKKKLLLEKSDLEKLKLEI